MIKFEWPDISSTWGSIFYSLAGYILIQIVMYFIKPNEEQIVKEAEKERVRTQGKRMRE